ncbi:MAG: hypothetical protein MUF04_14350 [Akkermansiaceae bacterium]|nr:hypothetical protein [Akkermansiaceae bacterium]
MNTMTGLHPGTPRCPHLPPVAVPLAPTVTRRHGRERGAAFYQDALAYAQSQWLCGKPAQALLQLNKAWSADLGLPAAVLAIHPPPYRALVWMMREGALDARGFLGNPVRHFQHLATRMSGPQAEIRSWRAWTCFHLAQRVLPAAWYPPDTRQLAREGIWQPGCHAALNRLRTLGWPGEAGAALRALDDATT